MIFQHRQNNSDRGGRQHFSHTFPNKTIRNKNKIKPGEAAPTAQNQRSAQSCGLPLPPIALGRRIKLSKKNKERVKTSQNKSNEPAAPPRGAAIPGKQKTKRFGANRKRGPEAPDFGIIAHAPKPPNPENTKRPASRAKGRGEKKPPEEQANAASKRPLGGGSNRLQPCSPFPLGGPFSLCSSQAVMPGSGRTVDS